MNILVTGGGGFLGKALIKALLEREHNVRSYSRSDYHELRDMGVEVMMGNINNTNDVYNATEDCELVFHVAALAGIWGDPDEYYQTNFMGTKNVIKACMRRGINRLIYTSSPSVIFDGEDHEKIDESAPYPEKHLSSYSETKAMAEKLLLESTGEELATISLRPHLIWGPGDNHLIPRILKKARAGKLKLVGNGKNLVDHTYIDNAVHAHILAMEKLEPESPLNGKAYFITNGEPVEMEKLINKILSAADLPPVTGKVPAGMAYNMGAFMEFVYTALALKEEPMMTRFLAKELSCSHHYDISAAKRDLGYEPIVSLDEGIEKLRNWLQENQEEEKRQG